MGSWGDMFLFKSRKQRERDAKKFDKWAFPYGEPQREKIAQILKELLPKEEAKAAMAVYLMGREAYRGSFRLDAEDLADRSEKDKMRTKELEKMNLTVIRVCNLDIDNNFRGVCEYIDEIMNRLSLSQLR